MIITNPTNPNRVHKHMAPWFSEECRASRQGYKAAARRHGRSSQEAITAFTQYRATCKAAASQFAAKLPDMLKYKPREFWKWVNYVPTTAAAIPPDTFAAHCKGLYTRGDCQGDLAAPTPPADLPPVTTGEVLKVLQTRFRG